MNVSYIIISKVKIQIPDNWNDEVIYFLWNCNNEGLIWSVDGKPLQGLTGGGGDDSRHEYILTKEDIKKKVLLLLLLLL